MTMVRFCGMGKMVLGLGLALGLGACTSTDIASRSVYNAPGVTLATQTGSAIPYDGPEIRAAQYNVLDVQIAVPRSLKVSEANMFYPLADIVWRGEPRGDRHQQVAQMYQEAMSAATGSMTRGRGVIVQVEVLRHHCLTEKTRYTVGGVHALKFQLTVTDAATGAVIDGPRVVVADVKASGGALAIAEDQQGRTQRLVVVERLTQVLRRELSQPVAATPELVARLQTNTALAPTTGAPQALAAN